MLWSLTVETVREKQNKTIFNIPLGFTRSQELVNDDLSAVSKVTELSFPQTESVRVGLGVTILKTENCKLRKMGAGSDKLSDSISTAESLLNRAVVTILVLVKDMSVSV